MMKDNKVNILLLLQLVLATLVLLFGIYGKVTETFDLLPIMLICLSAMILIIGIREYKRTHSRWWGSIYLCISLFILFSAVQGMH